VLQDKLSCGSQAKSSSEYFASFMNRWNIYRDPLRYSSGHAWIVDLLQAVEFLARLQKFLMASPDTMFGETTRQIMSGDSGLRERFGVGALGLNMIDLSVSFATIRRFHSFFISEFDSS